MNTIMGKPLGGGDHRMVLGECLFCNQPDYMTQAIANRWYDPSLDWWDTDAHKQEYMRSLYCPITPLDVDPFIIPWPVRFDEQ